MRFASPLSEGRPQVSRASARVDSLGAITRLRMVRKLDDDPHFAGHNSREMVNRGSRSAPFA